MAKGVERLFGLVKETRINKERDYQDALKELYVTVESRTEEGCRRLQDDPWRQAVEFRGHPFWYHTFDGGPDNRYSRPEDMSSIRCTKLQGSDIIPDLWRLGAKPHHIGIFHIVILSSPFYKEPPSIEITTLSKFINPTIPVAQPTEKYARYGGQFALHYVHFQLDLGLWLYKEDVQFKEKKMSEEVAMDPNTVEGVKKMAKVVSSWHLVDSRNPDHPDYKPPPKPEEIVWGG